MKIAIIGTGRIGSTLARFWVRAGHNVILCSRHPNELETFAKELGPNASVAPCEEAARDSDLVLLAIPLGEVPRLSSAIRESVRDKVVIDACNPYPDRDGEAAKEVFREGNGTGVWTRRHLPGARIVRAFNTVRFDVLQSEANRPGDPIGVPIASDDSSALKVVSDLVRDAGHGAVVVGELKRAKEFDPNTKPFASGASTTELEKMFGLRKAA